MDVGTALVTGGTGFVGAAVARALLGRGFRVKALVRPGSRRQNLLGLDLELVEGDLLDPSTLPGAVARCSAVFHVAADYRLWVRDPAKMNAANVDGTVALLRAAAEAGVSKIVYTSSVATLGREASGSPADESTPVRESDMIGVYKHSKFLAERAVEKLVADGVPVVTVNPSTPIGPRDIKPTPTGRIIVEAGAGRMPAYVDTGLNVVHVDDVAEGHLLAFERGEVGERYVLGGENLALRDILVEVARLVDRSAPRMRLPHAMVVPMAYIAEGWFRLVPPKIEPMLTIDSVRMSKKRMFFSHAKAAERLGYSPRPAIEAIADAVDWFRDNRYI